MRAGFLIAALAVASVTGCARAASSPVATEARSGEPTDQRDQRLTAHLEDIVRVSRGRLGVAFRVLEDDRSYQLRGGEAFPMASVYKFPIALAVLAKTERKELDPKSSVALNEADLSIPYSPIADEAPANGRTMTITELLEAMVVASDNTACDVLLRMVGAGFVTKNIERLGVHGVRVDRTELEIDRDVLQTVIGQQATVARNRKAVTELEDSLTPEQQDTAWRAYWSDARDSATPDGMVELLARFQHGDTLGPQSTSYLRSLLERSPQRMGLKLPPGTVVAHKTGTGLGSFNDVGIVTLPDGKHLAVAIFLKQGQALSLNAGSELIADVGRAIYDEAVR